MGILAPIIFVAIYFLLYGFFKLFATPHIFHGWFIYLGAVVAGVITYLAGASINSEIYDEQKRFPHQNIYSHSFFFLSMEIWGIIFSIITIAFGIINTAEVNKKTTRQELVKQKRQNEFDQKVHLLDSIIQNPQTTDYYLAGFNSFSLPLKVTNFNETQIELFCPFNDPRINKIKYSNRMELLKSLSEIKEEGFKIWIDKTKLKELVNRIPNHFNKVHIPELVKNDPINLNDIWRIDGPDFKEHTWDWNSGNNGSKIELKNIGLYANIQRVMFNGREVFWRKVQHVGAGNVRHKGVDYSNDKIVRMEQHFTIFSSGFEPGPNPKFEIFCKDHRGRAFRFDITKGERRPKIIRHRL